MAKNLIQFGKTDAQGHLADMMMVIAATVEESLIQAGATPGEDYTILDLYKLANPYTVSLFKKKDDGDVNLAFYCEGDRGKYGYHE